MHMHGMTIHIAFQFGYTSCISKLIKNITCGHTFNLDKKIDFTGIIKSLYRYRSRPSIIACKAKQIHAYIYAQDKAVNLALNAIYNYNL